MMRLHLIALLILAGVALGDTIEDSTTSDSSVIIQAERAGLIGEWPKSEAILFELDQRRWKIGYAVTNEQDILIEYVLENESVEDWSEMVTTRLFKGAFRRGSVADVFKLLEEASRKQCSGAHWLPLISGAESIVYEWNNEACVEIAKSEYELARIFRGERGVHRISYACKDKEKFTAERDNWLDRFINSIERK